MAKLKVSATLDRTEYERGLEAMKNAGKGLNDSLQSLGAIGGVMAGVFGGNLLTGAISKAWEAITGAMGEARKEAVKLGHESENIGIHPEEFEEIANVFHRFGMSGDEVSSMFGRLETARNKLLAGNPATVKAFRDLGLSMEQVASMDPKELFDAVSAAYAKGGGSGMTGTAAADIFGKGMRNVGNQRAMMSYGGGERFDPAIKSTDWDTVAIELREIQKERRSQSWRNVWKTIQGTAASAPHGVSPHDVQAEIDAREAANAKRAEDNKAAIEQAKQERRERDAAVAAENERFQDAEIAERDEEIKRGVRLERPETDQYRRRGLIAGNAASATDNMAYVIARQHVQISMQILECNRRMEAKMSNAAEHKKALRTIAERYPGLSHGDESEGEGIE